MLTHLLHDPSETFMVEHRGERIAVSVAIDPSGLSVIGYQAQTEPSPFATKWLDPWHLIGHGSEWMRFRVVRPGQFARRRIPWLEIEAARDWRITWSNRTERVAPALASQSLEPKGHQS